MHVLHPGRRYCPYAGGVEAPAEPSGAAVASPPWAGVAAGVCSPPAGASPFTAGASPFTAGASPFTAGALPPVPAPGDCSLPDPGSAPAVPSAPEGCSVPCDGCVPGRGVRGWLVRLDAGAFAAGSSTSSSVSLGGAPVASFEYSVGPVLTGAALPERGEAAAAGPGVEDLGEVGEALARGLGEAILLERSSSLRDRSAREVLSP